MSKKIIAFLISSLFIITLIPITEAGSPSLSGTYQNCYIQSSGTIVNRFSLGLFKIGNKAFIVYLNVGFKDNGTTTIYDEENGNVLWNKQGEQSVVLFFFRGNYTYIKDPVNGSFLGLDGLAVIARV